MLVKLKVRRLEALWSPYANGLWGRHILTRDQVTWCHDNNLAASPDMPTPWDDGDAAFLSHAMRIVWLIRAPRLDPIHVTAAWDVWPIRDGNHRLAAAIFREDDIIMADYLGDPETLAVLDGSVPTPWEAASHREDDHLFASPWWDERKKVVAGEYQLRRAACRA